MSADPWFNVEKSDVFPEQFPTFLFPPGPQRDLFLELHPECAEPSYWRSQQERLKAGIQEDLFAYSEKERFTNRYG
jgi:isocitrate dehydrogenase kinase/phosphatase